MFEQLESRQMLSVCVVGSKLIVCGSDDSEVICVSSESPFCWKVATCGDCTEIKTSCPIKIVEINGKCGDDLIILCDNVCAKGYLNGDEGCDTLVGGSGPDVFCGGCGEDWVDYSCRECPLVLTLNGVADDGKACERDNIKGDVENIFGGQSCDLIVGNECDNFLVGNCGNDRIFGLCGDDTLEGCDGCDSLDGGDGCDYLIGGYGQDTLLGGCGDDTFLANDGCYDIIIGGQGCDTAFMDCIDNFCDIEQIYLVPCFGGPA